MKHLLCLLLLTGCAPGRTAIIDIRVNGVYPAICPCERVWGGVTPYRCYYPAEYGGWFWAPSSEVKS